MTPAFLYKDIDFASNKKRFNMNRYFINGVHEGIRTPDRTLRRRVLYPAELLGHYPQVLTKYSTKCPHLSIKTNYFL